jgi:hypothetical protein
LARVLKFSQSCSCLPSTSSASTSRRHACML